MIELENLGKSFGETRALSGVSLTMAEGSFTSLLGPSGCGKSTTLRLIAGLDRPTTGRIRIAGRDVTGLTAAERNIAMVFQSYALYPHMTVRQNINLPLAMRNMTRVERLPVLDRLLPSARRKMADHAARVREVARLLEIDALLERKPAELSGGQKQRVAVGRALVRDPIAFLFDEPLSNLDAKLRIQMRGEIVDLHRRTGRTFVYVTHDQAEAMSMSDRIAVFMAGEIRQVATPRELFERPASREVAAFVGDRPINLIDVAATGAALPPPFDGFAIAGPALPPRVTLGIRPETLDLVPEGPLAGRVGLIEYLGSEAMVTFHLSGAGAEDVTLRAALDAGHGLPAEGDAVSLALDAAAAHLFDADTGRRLDARLVARDGAAAAGSGLRSLP
ncbi:MAG: ABC transporter ATP-binding protein [Hyphomicrobiales bacterium]|nr:ABC transporter ATP-binding protein [Hyphomicrobiales bacterium]MCP5370355.1 ABC transporter ATP-binding protein [Hyphomicrobiales bacterium]